MNYGSTWRKIAMLVVPMALFACRGAGNPPDPAVGLLAADRAFAQASLESGAAQAFGNYLTEDALSLPNGRNPVTGRDTIVAGMAGNFTLTWSPQRAEVAASGDMGWTWGAYQLSSEQAGGTTAVSYGKYLNVWRKDSGGHWKVAVDMGNDSPPPQ